MPTRKPKRAPPDKTEFVISDRKIKASLPADQARAIGEQIRELVSPFVEGAGVIGDYLRFFRQRAAIAAIKRVRDLADENDIRLQPVPPKFLIPWVEGVSIEEDDPKLAEMWAQLLLCAVKKPESARPIFIDTLKKMQRPEAMRLEEIWLPFRNVDDASKADNISVVLESTARRAYERLRTDIAYLLQYRGDENMDWQGLFWGEIDDTMRRHMKTIQIIGLQPKSVEYPNKQYASSEQAIATHYAAHEPTVLATLAALQLVDEGMYAAFLDLPNSMGENIIVRYYRLSIYGQEFMRACHTTDKRPYPLEVHEPR